MWREGGEVVGGLGVGIIVVVRWCACACDGKGGEVLYISYSCGQSRASGCAVAVQACSGCRYLLVQFLLVSLLFSLQPFLCPAMATSQQSMSRRMCHTSTPSVTCWRARTS